MTEAIEQTKLDIEAAVIAAAEAQRDVERMQLRLEAMERAERARRFAYARVGLDLD